MGLMNILVSADAQSTMRAVAELLEADEWFFADSPGDPPARTVTIEVSEAAGATCLTFDEDAPLDHTFVEKLERKLAVEVDVDHHEPPPDSSRRYLKRRALPLFIEGSELASRAVLLFDRIKDQAAAGAGHVIVGLGRFTCAHAGGQAHLRLEASPELVSCASGGEAPKPGDPVVAAIHDAFREHHYDVMLTPDLILWRRRYEPVAGINPKTGARMKLAGRTVVGLYVVSAPLTSR